METPNSGKKAEVPKRRACDECRGKKLACSKELDGCARCKREGIPCVYSAQKPMGRPRKRAHDEVEAALKAQAVEPQEKHQHIEIVPPFDSSLGLELDMSFLDFDNQDMNFFDIIDTKFTAGPDLVLDPFLGQPVPSALEQPQTGTDDRLYMGDYIGGTINFDFNPQPQELPPPDPQGQISREDIESILAAEMPEKTPSLSPPPSHTASNNPTPSASSDNDLHLPPPPTCACLHTLYLALDSLQRLPNEVGAAMKVARTATRRAHEAVLCNTCGNPPLTQRYVPPIASFQNLMMLGALLPSLAHAYTRILTMVDDAACKADHDRRKITFDLDSYGGLWGTIANDFTSSTAKEKLTAAPLEPSLWRLTVRAMLKIDVYGLHQIENDPMPVTSCVNVMNGGYPGLKDIITLVEERSRKRHQELDLALAAGLVQKPENCDYDIGGEPPCMRIINIAKKTLDDLVIP
ncbi:hypothetical protein QBC34DRAFT_125837 [Podospora aff. communis PSN243]|uniref:Zn(2)-C6 fungal-type domain-containing protein n=1 Tax=Podospora aff. communis PSN243 TaxID=3040156 RepID=A0AAV9GHG6_9PEZI|nr:hypothetical protein QBC34DRAFT_125837 [Podospora aff. communis PSN243]